MLMVDSSSCSTMKEDDSPTLPEGEHQGHGRYYRVGPSSKCLGMSEDYVCYGQISENKLTTWVLMEDDDSIEESVWSLRHETELPNFNSRKISLMAFSPMDRDVVILDCGMQLLSLDVTTVKSEFLQRLCVPPSNKSFQTQHGNSPFIVKPTLTTISNTRRLNSV
ncbi:uncharacterized protein LOC113335823 [Papaver somniferum]|uniref:uncharacterized protein LOC113335823 n=1 Tax=Papaver somniferum TaxID=3469 RepID=UPI000E6FC96C|nr:uncharacterized protein LOC113335823 [Papaver somniferum]